MMSNGGLREVFQTDQRTALDDAHTAKVYELYRERTKTLNAMLSAVAVLSVVAIFVAASVSVIFVVWFWKYML